jgi:UDP-N-acetylmuramyl pentapeptide phosphotransferase/UDP-N-acetylglucosamine-1-phosphate transferase
MTSNWISEIVFPSDGFFPQLATSGVKYLMAFFAALGVSLVLTPLFRDLARRIGMVDQPSARRINKTPVPRGGGLSIFLAFQLVLCGTVFALHGPICQQFSYEWQLHFLLASSILVLIGLIDDKRGMRPWVKLLGQILVASILFFSNVHVGGIGIAFPPWLDYAVTVFWIVGAVNAFNLIDGMDGLATGLALIASVGLVGALLFTGNSAATLPYLILAGACLGFLRYNFHPASVFLGDTGSMFLGLCVATFPLMTGSRKELVASLGVPLLAMGVPIFDTMLAIWRRTVRAMLPQGIVASSGARFRVMQPDKDHLHHRILRETMNQRTAAMILYGVSAALVAVGLAGTLLRNRAPGLFMIAFVVAIIVVVRHLARVELWDTGRLLASEHPLQRRGLLVPAYVVLDVCTLCAIWVFVRWVLDLPLGRLAVISCLPLYVAPTFVFLVLTKVYWRVWSRAQVRDYALLGFAVFAGASVGAGLVWLLGEVEQDFGRFTLLFAAFSVFPIVGFRIWRDSVSGIMQVLERRMLLDKADTTRVFVYGGGVRFRSYMREMAVKSGHNDHAILGIIDDDIHLKGRIIAGYTVLGGIQDLRDLVLKWRVDGLVITCVLSPEKRSEVLRLCESMGVLVSLFECVERPLEARKNSEASAIKPTAQRG